MSAASRIKVAVIGAGRWGWQHTRVFAERPDVDLCAVVGRTRDKTEARAAEFGIRAYVDIQEMLDHEHPDLVSLSLPNQGHFEATLQVIQAGVPLLAEKPLAFTLDEANILVAEGQKRDLFFAINFNHRYAKPLQLARAAIQEGRVGEVVFATWRFGGEGSSTHPHANLIETQCHAFDQMEHLCGPIDSVMAEMTGKTGGGYRTLVLALHFANGAVGSLLGTYDSSYAYAETHRLEINGTAGRVVVEDTVRRYTYQAAGNESAEVWQAGYFNDRDREFKRTFDYHVEQMLDAFRRGEKPPIPAQAGQRALALAYAAIDSFESGQRVKVETTTMR
jgi:myo-inositol 2-dehydrogenase/D-chiro-inositol 1-dehydrogenase